MMPKGVEHRGVSRASFCFCAQRLSASSEFSRAWRNSSSCSVTCAQRLSASSEFSRVRGPALEFQLPVLNAFRHHRNSHVVPDTVQSICLYVLNAFRHHRNSHFESRHFFHFVDLCSTPYGIIGI